MRFTDGLTTFPVKLKAARIAAGLSVRQAAKKAGVSVSVVTYSESTSDARKPGIEIVARFCDTYGTTMNDLFTL